MNPRENVLSFSPKCLAIFRFVLLDLRLLYKKDNDPNEVISSIIQLDGRGLKYLTRKASINSSSLLSYSRYRLPKLLPCFIWFVNKLES